LGSENRFEIIGDVDYLRKHRQFYLNLAIGLELLLKSIMLKQEMPINKQMKLNGEIHLDKEKTLQFSEIIKNNIANIFSNIDQLDLEELKDTLKLINLRRNNIAHSSKKSTKSYRDEHQFSYVTLYIYEEFFFGMNSELTQLLLLSIKRSKVTQGADFPPLNIRPRSLLPG
jgi:hypothetical protein